MDNIRQRLAEIDKELARSPAYYHRQTIDTAPLVFCATGLIAGIIIQEQFILPARILLALLALCAAILFISLLPWPRRLTCKIEKEHLIPYIVLLCSACLGAIRLASFNRAQPDDIRNAAGDTPTLATVRGVIVTKPYISTPQWRFARFTPADPGSSFYLQTTEAQMVDGWNKASGLVWVRVKEPLLDLKAGDSVQLYCWLDKFGGPSNPGEFDMATYMSRKGAFFAAFVESREAIEVMQSGAAGLFMKMKTTMRKMAVETLLGGPHPDNEAESLLLALVLGHRTNIDNSTIRAFRETGLLHFICLSGMNFGMVIGFVWWACKTAGLMKPGRAIVCMITAVLFLMAVPENAPAFRAAVMCFAFCGSFIFRRQSNPFNSLALAAVVLLLIRPTELFEADWQLSFVSVLGILLLCPLIYPILREKTIDNPWFTDFVKTKPFLRIVAKPVPSILGLFSTSFAAWLSTTGIMLYHFYNIQWLTSIWTVLVSPLIAITSLLGYIKLFVAMLLPTAANLLGVVVNYLSSLLIWIVKLFAGLDISEILIGKTNPAAIILFYGLIVFAFFSRPRYPVLKKVICATAAAAIVAMLVTPRWQNTYSKNLTVTALDVGHGQAILTQLPGGTTILLDAGSLSRTDVGTRVITPFLRYKGVAKINAVVLSHADIDHVNGLLEVLDDYPAGVIYSNDICFANPNSPPAVKFLHDELQRKNIEIKSTDDQIIPAAPAAVKLLWPIREIYEDEKIGANDKSVAMLIEYAGRRILLCSDIEKFAQRELLRLYPDLKADILSVPHHGSVKTLEQNFIKTIKPSAVICSCSEPSYKKGQVIGQLDNIQTYYTGTDGAITICIDRDGVLRITTFNNKKAAP